MKQVFRDTYGGRACIKKWGDKYTLTAWTCYGDKYHEGKYDTYRGAKIALGRITEGMYEEVKE